MDTLRIRWNGGEATFEPGTTVRVGRDADAQVQSRNTNVSRRHVEVTHTPSGWVLRDMVARRDMEGRPAGRNRRRTRHCPGHARPRGPRRGVDARGIRGQSEVRRCDGAARAGSDHRRHADRRDAAAQCLVRSRYRRRGHRCGRCGDTQPARWCVEGRGDCRGHRCHRQHVERRVRRSVVQLPTGPGGVDRSRRGMRRGFEQSDRLPTPCPIHLRRIDVDDLRDEGSASGTSSTASGSPNESWPDPSPPGSATRQPVSGW